MNRRQPIRRLPAHPRCRRLRAATAGAAACLTLLLSPPGAAAQTTPEESAPLVTDRPDFTESASTVEPGRFQIEAGVTHTEEDFGEVLSIGEALVRIGLSDRLELRVGINSWIEADAPGGGVSGYEDPSLGVKLRLGGGEGSGPDLAILLSTTLPAGSKELRNAEPQPGVLLAAAWELTPTFGIGANLGYAYLGEDGNRFGEVSASVSVGVALCYRLGGFLELFGTDAEGGPQRISADLGVTRPLSEDAQVDLRVGFGLNDEAADWFVGAGLARRW